MIGLIKRSDRGWETEIAGKVKVGRGEMRLKVDHDTSLIVAEIDGRYMYMVSKKEITD